MFLTTNIHLAVYCTLNSVISLLVIQPSWFLCSLTAQVKNILKICIVVPRNVATLACRYLDYYFEFDH